MMQSIQLTTNIPNNSPNNTEIGQQDDYDYQDNREEYLYQVDGTMDIDTPTDHSADDRDTEPDNNVCKRQRKTYAPADTIRKDLTKQRQAQLLKNQQEKERVKAQALENRDKTDKMNRNKANRPTAQLEDNRDNIYDTLIGIESLSSGYLTHHILDPKVLSRYLEAITDDMEDTECQIMNQFSLTFTSIMVTR